jgi:hypothetical protein
VFQIGKKETIQGFFKKIIFSFRKAFPSCKQPMNSVWSLPQKAMFKSNCLNNPEKLSPC